MGEEELRAVHTAAQKSAVPTSVPVVDKVTKAQCNVNMDLDEDEEEDEWVEHAEYADEDEQVFHFDEELQDEDRTSIETPSLRADSGSPSPPRPCSRSSSCTGGSIPGTPEIHVEATVPSVDAKFLRGLNTFESCQKKRNPIELFHLAAPRSIV